MADIRINEISQNYTYNVGSSTYATVALPITAMWGPCYQDPDSLGMTVDDVLEDTAWKHFTATQSGLESFVATYRGPSSNYRVVEDYSYHMAMTLLTAGYDILVCRVCPGTHGQCTLTEYAPGALPGARKHLTIKAKYPGSFGDNKIKVVLKRVKSGNAIGYWSLTTYILDSSSVQTAVENLIFVFDEDNATESIPHISEVESNFLTFVECTMSDSIVEFGPAGNTASGLLTGGTDIANTTDAKNNITKALNYAVSRYEAAGYTSVVTNCPYVAALKAVNTEDVKYSEKLRYKEWIYTAAYNVYGLLIDKLNYNPQRIISPGWDDQNICDIDDDDKRRISQVSPLHIRLMSVGYYSRCGTSLIDIPRSSTRAYVYNESTSNTSAGYAQMLSRYIPSNSSANVNSSLYCTHSALFAPWGSYQFVGLSKQHIASPSFLALMLQRAMILNQSAQYEWALPTDRKHNLKIGALEYKVPKKLLDEWQNLEGVGVNVITDIPELGLSLWGNSTLYELPPATYQALANLSTRYLVNAVENIAYKCGLSITFQYNNDQAYNKFYAGVTPTLDTMKNVGAIDDYYVRMSADINGLDQVNANTVIGKIYLVINGVINDIVIDLVALPPGVDLEQYKS